MAAQVGDKVRLRDVRKGCRGTVTCVVGRQIEVTLDEERVVLTVKNDAVTNYSDAARKAWRKMPNRRVGRPAGSRQCDRVSVTLRLDRELWERFRNDEAIGSIPDRTALVNAWFREMLDHLEAPKAKTNGVQSH